MLKKEQGQESVFKINNEACNGTTHGRLNVPQIRNSNEQPQPLFRKTSALRKRWICQSNADSNITVGLWKRCKKMKCFEDCDKKYLTLQRRIILPATK